MRLEPEQSNGPVNPLNPTGVLTLRIPRPGPVTVRMFDLQGRLVRTILEGRFLSSGEHKVGIDGRGERGVILASGVYFYRAETSEGVVTGRLAVMKCAVTRPNSIAAFVVVCATSRDRGPVTDSQGARSGRTGGNRCTGTRENRCHEEPSFLPGGSC